jgi:hypothetical protein
VVLGSDLRLWLGNEGEATLTISGLELCGFNTGAFDFKIIDGKLDQTSIPWRLCSDFDLLVNLKDDRSKSVVPLCQFLHFLASTRGLADVQLRDHDLKPKLLPAVPQFAFNFCS